MSKLLIQCNDEYTLNLINHEKVLPNISHIVTTNINEKHIKELFQIKHKYRHIKLLLQINITDNLDISDCIKTICNYGFDGIIFSINNINAIDNCVKLAKVLKVLPEPYNFEWELYYININFNIFKDLKQNSEFTEILTGIINVDKNELNKEIENIKIYDITDNISSSHLYITDLNKHILHLLMNIDKRYIMLNNIDYPTSKFIKQIIQ